MFIFVLLRVAIRSLYANKLRSFLSMLGITIGVTAVVAMISMGSGAKASVEKQISSIGSNLLIVLPGATTSGGARMGMGTKPSLTLGDTKAIEELSSVFCAAPIWGGVAQVVYVNQNWSTGVQGTTPSYFIAKDWEIEEGRTFNNSEVKASLKVAVIGKTVQKNLFGVTDPVGKIIRIRHVPFTVIGILSPKGSTAHGDQDDVIFVPIATAQRKLFGTTLPGVVKIIIVKAKNTELVKTAEREINSLLMQRHRIRAGQDKDFTVRDLTEITSAVHKISTTLSLLLGSIAMISLIVGGIGIMNIMLVSVTERTREIGIRMAVGATTANILMQFLIESIVLSIIGGFMGIIFGMIASLIMAHFMQWPILISWQAILLAFIFSAGVGIFFGFYPAKKASKLNPIDALRSE
ncbi:MAG: ABC transporter permease [Campylobacterota bacterium]|nr:ABC transporter permease [Campylobacterota bacterium]